MINAERLTLLRHGAEVLQRVRDGLRLPSRLCGNCGASVELDPEASRLDDDLGATTARLREWIEVLECRPAASERVSS